MIALAHGTSDGQKTMGVITLVLITAGYQESGTGPQFWVIATAGLAIGLGTYSGGWRIMRTMGKGIVDITVAAGLRRRDHLRGGHPRLRRTWASGCPPPRSAPGSIIGSGVGREAGRGPLGHRPQDGLRLAADPAGGRAWSAASPPRSR